MEMPDTYPVNPHAQATTASTKPGELSPSLTLSSESSLSSSSSSKHHQHRRLLSLDSLEATSTKILTHIRQRSRSPLPRASSPTTDKQRRSPSPTTPPLSAAPPSEPISQPPSPSPVDQCYSPSAMSPTVSDQQRPGMGNSRTSDISTTSTSGSSERTRSNSYKRYSGTVNHYGRHSNDWLFGGFSVRDTLRDGIDKLRGGSERDS